MKFVYTYKQKNNYKMYNIYYYVDNKRVSEDKFNLQLMKCRLKDMQYNASSMTHKNNRYKAVFYYN